ncbi:hypothetical protein ACWD7F_27585 [Streptomyces sp. NPDC005122]
MPFANLAISRLSGVDGQSAVLHKERDGIAYLRPLDTLVTALSDAQSDAVQHRGAGNTAALAAAVGKLDAADARYGAELATQQRWRNLRKRVAGLRQSEASGAAAYSAYGDAIDLALALVAKVGDTSTLILDPALDTYHLVDASMVQAPSLLVDSGRMADLAWLAHRGAGSPADTLAVAEGRVFTARDRVSTAAAAIDADVRTSFEASDSTSLAPDLAGPLDEFRHVVSAFAPVTSLADLSVDASQAPAVIAAQSGVEKAGNHLEAAMLDELEQLLQTRQESVQNQQEAALAAVAAFAMAAGWAAWTLLPHRGRLRSSENEPAQAGPGADPAAGTGEGVPTDRAGDGLTDVIDARELVENEELARVGRAVQRRQRGASHHAQ